MFLVRPILMGPTVFVHSLQRQHLAWQTYSASDWKLVVTADANQRAVDNLV